jgi:hypothetical protein
MCFLPNKEYSTRKEKSRKPIQSEENSLLQLLPLVSGSVLLYRDTISLACLLLDPLGL